MNQMRRSSNRHPVAQCSQSAPRPLAELVRAVFAGSGRGGCCGAAAAVGYRANDQALHAGAKLAGIAAGGLAADGHQIPCPRPCATQPQPTSFSPA